MEYISVKVSSVFSQLNLVAFDATREYVKERLRALYRQAMAATMCTPMAASPKFVNLDMEAYTDLHLTVAAFTEVLDELEFLMLSAGIVLQAYLPDAFSIQQDLTTWAMARCARSDVPIKIRIVKGANLAMEQVEAALHGWPQAPTPRSWRLTPTSSVWSPMAANPSMRGLYSWAWPSQPLRRGLRPAVATPAQR